VVEVGEVVADLLLFFCPGIISLAFSPSNTVGTY